MRVNVTSLKIEHKKPEGVEIHISTDDYYEWMVLDEQQVETLIMMAQGETGLALNLGHAVLRRIGPNVLQLIVPKSQHIVETHEFEFPMNDFASLLWHRLYNPGSSVTLTPEECKEIRKLHWPRPRLIFGHDKARERFMDCIHGKPEGFTEKTVAQLRGCIRHLMRVTRNYSDADYGRVEIYTDPVPHSFYFMVKNKDERVSNGGIICHDFGNGPEYHLHT